jgi:hypothetical protein
VEEWTVAISDITPTVRRIRDLLKAGDHQAAAAHLPAEHAYPLPDQLRTRIGASPTVQPSPMLLTGASQVAGAPGETAGIGDARNATHRGMRARLILVYRRPGCRLYWIHKRLVPC